MATWIDGHSHLTPPERAGEFGRLAGEKPQLDSFDSADSLKRLEGLHERNPCTPLHL